MLAAIFVSDPINTPRELQTTSGNVHNLGGALGLLGFLGTLVISIRLLRCAVSRSARMAVWIATAIVNLASSSLSLESRRSQHSIRASLVRTLPSAGRTGSEFLADVPGWRSSPGTRTALFTAPLKLRCRRRCKNNPEAALTNSFDTDAVLYEMSRYRQSSALIASLRTKNDVHAMKRRAFGAGVSRQTVGLHDAPRLRARAARRDRHPGRATLARACGTCRVRPTARQLRAVRVPGAYEAECVKPTRPPAQR